MAWEPEIEKEVEKIFHKRASHRLSELLRGARDLDKKPPFIGESDWHVLKEKWNTPEFKEKCEKAKKNRASERGSCIHTSGSVNAAQTHRRLVNLINYYFIFSLCDSQFHDHYN